MERYYPDDDDNFEYQTRRVSAVRPTNFQRQQRMAEQLYTEPYAATSSKEKFMAKFMAKLQHKYQSFFNEWNHLYDDEEIQNVLESTDFDFNKADKILSQNY